MEENYSTTGAHSDIWHALLHAQAQLLVKREQALLEQAMPTFTESVKEMRKEMHTHFKSLQGQKYPLVHFSAIRETACKYGLLLRSANANRDELPYHLHLKVSALELKENTTHSVYIISEGSNFKNGFTQAASLVLIEREGHEFLVIGDWGHLQNAKRRLKQWMFASFQNYALTMLFTAFVLNLLTPDSWLGVGMSYTPFYIRVAYQMWLLFLLAGISVYFLTTFRKGLNHALFDAAWALEHVPVHKPFNEEKETQLN